MTVAVVIALAAVLGWIFSGRALRPVHQITTAARAASGHNLSARVAPTGPRDELRELAETFDEMFGRLEAAFEGQQRFIANASHELRTRWPSCASPSTSCWTIPMPRPATCTHTASDVFVILKAGRPTWVTVTKER
jgi:HAMP domain-containing protein